MNTWYGYRAFLMEPAATWGDLLQPQGKCCR